MCMFKTNTKKVNTKNYSIKKRRKKRGKISTGLELMNEITSTPGYQKEKNKCI